MAALYKKFSKLAYKTTAKENTLVLLEIVSWV